MSTDMFPRTVAYCVGGPADGMEQEVAAGVDMLYWAEAVPVKLSSSGLVPRHSMVTHMYRPCPETGEWLWQGAK